MKQSLQFRTKIGGKARRSWLGSGKETEMCADTSSAAHAVRSWREKCSTWYLLLICSFFQLPSLRDSCAWSDSESDVFWPSANADRELLCPNK